MRHISFLFVALLLMFVSPLAQAARSDDAQLELKNPVLEKQSGIPNFDCAVCALNHAKNTPKPGDGSPGEDDAIMPSRQAENTRSNPSRATQ